MDSLAALVMAILTALGLGGAAGSPAPKAVPHGAVGHDISWPQCGQAYPTGSAFGIVGVTHGRPYEPNPCLTSEYAWAKGAPGGPGFYMNTANPGPASGAVSWYRQKSPDPACSPGQQAACAYDYGFNAAAHAYTYAQSQTGHAGGTAWWLDVEIENTWSPTDLVANLAAVRGSVDYLQHQPGTVVGIYSTRSQWTTITGGAQLPLANWVAGARSAGEARARCAPAFSATGGPVVLSQYFGPFDADVAC